MPTNALMSKSSGGLGQIMMVFGVLLFALFMGALLGLGNIILVLPFLVIAGALVFGFLPVSVSIWALCVLSMIVVGPVIYFAKLEHARWIPPLIAIAFVLPLFNHFFSGKHGERSGLPAFVYLLVIYLAGTVFSTIISKPMLGELITSWKGYYAFWPVMLILILGALKENHFPWIWRFLLGASVLQMPVALYQRFVVAPRTQWLTPLDAVVGTFPGSAEASGASQAMGIFVLISMVVALSLYRSGLLKWYWLALVLGAGLVTLGTAEIKGVVLLIPVAAGVLFARTIMIRPVRSLMIFILGVMATFALINAYNVFNYSTSSGFAYSDRPKSAIEQIMNQFDPERERKDRPEFSRAGLLKDWWQRNVEAGDMPHALFGHGIGATQYSRFGVGELALINKYQLGETGTSLLLWEVGLVGHAFFLAALLVAARTSARLARSDMLNEEHQALMNASTVALVLFIASLPYKAMLFETAPTQFLMVLVLGYVGYWWRRQPPGKEFGL